MNRAFLHVVAKYPKATISQVAAPCSYVSVAELKLQNRAASGNDYARIRGEQSRAYDSIV